MNFIIQAVVMIVISVALSLVSSLLFPPQKKQQTPQQPENVPKPADGKYNLKQNVPPLSFVLGTVKKGGDYSFLEERGGQANHVLVVAGHRITAITRWFLHDEEVTLNDVGGVVPPASMANNVGLAFKFGLDIETAWDSLVATYPEIWTVDHRGDGLAQVKMDVNTVSEEHYNEVFPQQMPVPTFVIQGARVYDPRVPAQSPTDESTWAYSENIALLRLWHLTHPSGGKLGMSDMHVADWAHAADICDEWVLSRIGVWERRYHGGMWYKTDTDPVEVGAVLDEAAELVIYETADGLIGVHAGEFVDADVRITADDIISISLDVNRRASSNVLAVRGRFTDPLATYNTVDAAIYGDPYVSTDDTQRTKTVDNQAVQRHNHIQRLQKLSFIRANAPLVSVVVAYSATNTSKNIPYRRFVSLDYPARGLSNAFVELRGRPKLGLANLTLTFEGRIVPGTLYDFDAATEEGVAAGSPTVLGAEGVPVPTGFDIEMLQVPLVGGFPAALAKATWTHQSDTLLYELQWQKSDFTEASQFALSRQGEDFMYSNYLIDGQEYRFKLRSRSGGAVSDWTAEIVAVAHANTTPPDPPVALASAVVAGDVVVEWDAPADPIMRTVQIWKNTSNDFSTALLLATDYGGPSSHGIYTDHAVSAGNTYYYWVRSLNYSGVASAEVGPTTETL